MQYLKSVRLQNVRKFEDATFTFKSGFNLIVGENGVGKSTLLKALQTIPNEISNRPTWRFEEIRLGSDGMQISHVVVELHSGIYVQQVYPSQKEREHRFSYRKRVGGWASKKEESIGTRIYFLGPDRPLIPSLSFRGGRINTAHSPRGSGERESDEGRTEDDEEITPTVIDLGTANETVSGDSPIDTVIAFTQEALAKLNPSYRRFIRRDIPFEIICDFRDSDFKREVIGENYRKEQQAVQDWLYQYFRKDPARMPHNLEPHVPTTCSQTKSRDPLWTKGMIAWMGTFSGQRGNPPVHSPVGGSGKT